ncbi:MAG TPA: DNA-primase RepB domain-containing protein [Polyangiaceae bacterium]
MNALASPTGRAACGPDLAQARAYLGILTGEVDPIVTFQTFSDRKTKGAKRDMLARVLHGTLRQRAAELSRLNEVGAGIFVMVNAGDLKGRREKNVTRVRALFIDVDDTQPRTFAVKPDILVRSGRGEHAYWLLAPGEPLEQFTPAQKRLAAFYGSDPYVADLSRVMRLPGFYHRKAEPVLVKLVHRSVKRHAA